jgi:DNA-binding NarL/FixJ family response regulator
VTLERRIGRRKDGLQKVRVVIAVEPIALSKVIEHLYGGAPEIQIISCLHEVLPLARQVKRLQPDLIIVNARLLGSKAYEMFTSIKRASPRSKLIFTDFDAELAGFAREWGADIYLEEEGLVKHLLSATRQLTGPRTARPASKSGSRTKMRSRAYSG